MVQNFGPSAEDWILKLFNYCITTYKIPRIWRVLALLKSGKDPTNPKSYRSISLLCITYKLYERMVLARISPSVEHLTRPDPSWQILLRLTTDLTQYIEDGYEDAMITRAVFVDLTAAYDTVNHRILLLKVTKNVPAVKIIQSLLSNIMFHVEMDSEKSLKTFEGSSTQTISVWLPKQRALKLSKGDCQMH